VYVERVCLVRASRAITVRNRLSRWSTMIQLHTPAMGDGYRRMFPLSSWEGAGKMDIKTSRSCENVPGKPSSVYNWAAIIGPGNVRRELLHLTESRRFFNELIPWDAE
jgi:hypothetical protein